MNGLIDWFARNHVAANLLMLSILLAGAVSLFTIRKQTTPDFELNTIDVRVPYLGAAPQEVEEGVVIKIEEAVQDVEGIVEMRGFAREGLGSVTIKVSQDADLLEVLNEVGPRLVLQTLDPLLQKDLELLLLNGGRLSELSPDLLLLQLNTEDN